MWNSKLVTKHLTKPDNFHEPCSTGPSSQSAKICTREAPQVPPLPILIRILKIKQYFQYTWNSNLSLLCFMSPPPFDCHSAHQCQVNMLPLGTSTKVNPGQPSDTALVCFSPQMKTSPKVCDERFAQHTAECRAEVLTDSRLILGSLRG